MDATFEKLIDEAILVELNIAELYQLLHRIFPQDSEFWWKLVLEEQNHASLLKTVKKMNDVNVIIPEDLLPVSIQELKKTNRLIRQYKEELEARPNRARAFQLAYELENSAGELHYDSFMRGDSSSIPGKLFKKLNGDDIDHARRIRQYMEEQGISLNPGSDTGL